MRRSKPFLEAEQSIAAARRRAKAKKEFWCMVWSGNGLTYTEMMQMDLAEYREAVEAKILYIEVWRPAAEARKKKKS